MKLEIKGDHEREKIDAMLKAADEGKLSPDVLIAQARRGFWNEPGGAESIFLLLRAISPATAKKIRTLIEREDEKKRRSQ